MCKLSHSLFESDIDWQSFRSALSFAVSSITAYFAYKVHNRVNKMVFDRFLNQEIQIDVFEDIVFNKNYKNDGASISEGDKKDIYIREILSSSKQGPEMKEVIIKNWVWSTFSSNIYDDTDSKDFNLNSRKFPYKILAIRDLAKYTNVNEKYEIFKK